MTFTKIWQKFDNFVDISQLYIIAGLGIAAILLALIAWTGGLLK